MLACAFDYLGIYSRHAEQNHEGGALGQGLAHQPQASFFPGLGLGFVSKYSSEREHFSWKKAGNSMLVNKLFSKSLPQWGLRAKLHQNYIYKQRTVLIEKGPKEVGSVRRDRTC